MTLAVQGEYLLPAIARRSIVGSVRRIVLAAQLVPLLEVSVAFLRDEEMRVLNKQWRKRDTTTDVLTFCAWEGQAMPGEELFLGDVGISVDTAARQARVLGHTLLEEVSVLMAHGMAHLLGEDHEAGEIAARRQAELELTLLDCAGLRPELSLLMRSF